MNVKELKELLAELPDEMPVILSKDEEGNGFSPLSSYSLGGYVADSTWSGEWYGDIPEEVADQYGPEDEAPENSVRAICLWPVN